jgi:DNA-binding LytR/AlgR family response regulator
VNDEVNRILTRLSDDAPKVLVGFKDEMAKLLEPSDVIRIFASSGKTFAATHDGEYWIKSRLYEIEERLKSSRFVRISNSEIINLQKVRSFDLNLVGTICVKFSNGAVSYVSRRYVADIKKVLGI